MQDVGYGGCLCPDRKYKRRKYANDSIHHGTQCAICGKWRTIKKHSGPILADELPWYDVKMIGLFDDQED